MVRRLSIKALEYKENIFEVASSFQTAGKTPRKVLKEVERKGAKG
jgi:hypothetical protein